MVNTLYCRGYKIRSFILLLAFFLWAFTTNAQDQKLRLNASPMPVSQVMQLIEQQTSLKFAFDKSYFDTSVVVSIRSSEPTLDEALKQITSRQSVTYLIHNGYIAISPVMGIASAATDKPTENTNNIRPVVYTAEALSGEGAIEVPAVAEVPVAVMPEEPVPTIVEHPATENVPFQPEEQVAPAIPYHSQAFPPETYFRKELPLLAIKTDLVYGLATLTPNLSGEIGLGRRTTFELTGSNNRWNRIGDKTDNKKFVHWTLRPEFRYWLCERFNGHFFGVNATYWQYNISGHDLLWMFDNDYRYNGRAWGAGVTYGYHHMLNKRWGLELTVGVGVAFMNHDKFDCHYCGDEVRHENKVYLGPTRASVSFVYLLK